MYDGNSDKSFDLLINKEVDKLITSQETQSRPVIARNPTCNTNGLERHYY